MQDFCSLCAAGVVGHCAVLDVSAQHCPKSWTETTLELLQITALSPVQIVREQDPEREWCRCWFTLPRSLPSSRSRRLLPGFNVRPSVTLFKLVMLFITALCFSMVALAIGAHARNTTSQAFSSLFVIAMAFGGMMAFFSFMTAAGEGIRFDESDTWWALALVVFLGLSTGYVSEAGGRRTGSRFRFLTTAARHPVGRRAH